MANIKTDKVTLKVEDGTSMDAFAAWPDHNAPHPGVIVYQEAFGVNNHIKNVVKRIAAEGYIAIAPELFHRTASAGYEAGYSDFEAVKPHFTALTTEGLSADAKASYDWLKSNPKLKNNKVGSVGFCLGGRASLITNITLPVSAAVSFYGGGSQNFVDRFNTIHAPQLFFWGGLDKHITHEMVEAVVNGMKHSGKEFINVEISYAEHAFFNEERSGYNPRAAKEAWAIMLAFFENNLAG